MGGEENEHRGTHYVRNRRLYAFIIFESSACAHNFCLSEEINRLES